MTLRDGARSTVRTCLNVKRGEYVLVLVDTPRRDIGMALYEETLAVGAEAMFTEMPLRARHGEELPEPIAAMMREMDVVIAATEFSLSHTQARRKASEAGARIVTMPMVTTEMMAEGGMTADYREVQRLVLRMRKRVARFRELTVTSERGTDLQFALGRRNWISDTGIVQRGGEFVNLPAGELFIAPLEGRTEGKLVVDGALGGFGRPDRPIVISVEEGKARRISGGRSAALLRETLRKQEKRADDPDAPYTVAEFGIGMNPKARITGNPLEDEKVLGTVHFALGDNSAFGGRSRAGIHIDAILTAPTVRHGKEVIISKGETG